MTGVTEPNSAADEVLAEYMRRVDAGEAVDRQAFLAAYPEIAAELKSYFDMEQDVIRRAGPANSESAAVPDSTHTALRRDTVCERSQGAAPPQGGDRGTPPENFGTYRILRELGRGAMGTVYLAEHTTLDRQVALKMANFSHDAHGELLARFRREARLAATLRHAHICPVHEVGEIDGWHYISMAYIEGQPLSALIRSKTRLPEKQALNIARKLAFALQEAHEHGIIHRDLKPGNVLCDAKGEPIITDFGLARRAGSEESARITHEGMIIGSPAYMSPEQIEADPDQLTPAADQYALGVILYEMLTGVLPFRGPLGTIITSILTKRATPLRQVRVDLDPRTEALCVRMTSRNASDRFPSLKAAGNEMISILKSLGAAPTVSASAPAVATATRPEAPNAGRKPKAKADEELTDAAIESLGATARKLLARRDFEQVLPLLEAIPENRRTDEVESLLERAQRQADEVMCLETEIDEAMRVNDIERVLQKTEALLKIKPNHPRAKKVQEQFGQYGGAFAARGFKRGRGTGETVGEGTWIPWGVLAFGLAVFGVALWGVTAYLKVGDAVVKVTINDPDVRVTIQGTTVSVEGAAQPLKVNPGDGKLKINYGGLEFESSNFTLTKGKNPVVEIELLDTKLAAKFGDQPIGDWTVPRKPAAAAPQRPAEKDAVAAASAGGPAPLKAPFDAAQARASQTEWARYLGVPVDYSNSLGMKFVLIPPGEYVRGSTDQDPDAQPDEKPAHRVRITRPIYLGTTEVTQSQYRKVTGKNPFQFQPDGVEARRVTGVDVSNFPAESVSWNDAVQFCQSLAEKYPPAPGKTKAEGYRLPTEAEWEHACRAGTTTRWAFGDTENAVNAQVLAGLDPKDAAPKPVGQLAPNAWGLFDMHGGLYEWCADGAGDYAATTDTAVDPFVAPNGEMRRVRGGSWDTPLKQSRSARRLALNANDHGQSTGFRVAIVLSQPSPPPAPVVAPFTPAQAVAHQNAWAAHLGLPVEFTNSVGMKLRLIPPGDYVVGLTQAELDVELAKVKGDGIWESRLRSSAPQHRVTLTQPYYVGVYEVTQKEYETVVGRNTSYLSPKAAGKDLVNDLDTNQMPVESLAWSQAVEFCVRLSERERLSPSYSGVGDTASLVAGHGYRLPTEAEWEVACRAGSGTRYWFGDDEGRLSEVAWTATNAGRVTHPVGQLKANPFGLHDVHGNVWEWCHDLYDPQFYAQYSDRRAIDPAGPAAASPLHRVFRGGGFTFDAGKHTSGMRVANSPNAVDHSIGFRVLLPATKASVEGRRP